MRKVGEYCFVGVYAAIVAAAIQMIFPSCALADYKLTTLGSFDGTNGAYPAGSLYLDATGSVYGVTGGGGFGLSTFNGQPTGYGTVYEIAAGASKITKLVTFNNSQNGTSESPNAPLIADAQGNLIGTTGNGGIDNDGTIFELAAGTRAFSTLKTFTNQADGADPVGNLISDAAGNIYGVTLDGGIQAIGGDAYGTVFKIASGTHAFSTLASFSPEIGEGPQGVVLDSAGNFYGTAANGGAGGGTVFEVTAKTHTPSDVETFPGANPIDVNPGLASDAAGNFYGTTQGGGPSKDGTVFEIAEGTHAFSTIGTFTGSNGAFPYAGLISDPAGNLYGTTESPSTVFEIPAGTQTITTLVTFNGNNGGVPSNGLIFDSAGDIFGSTNNYGAYGDGTVFEIAAGSHAFTTIANFNGFDGNYPNGPLICDASGNLYGVTLEGGANGFGAVYELSPIPEPGTGALAAVGAFVALIRRRRNGVRQVANVVVPAIS